MRSHSHHQNSEVLIIGGGIAGTSAAHALASRGVRVTLLEQHPAVAQEASGNPAGILFPAPALRWTAAADLTFTAYAHVRRLLAQLVTGGHTISHDFCGMFRMPKDEKEEARLKRIAEELGLHHSIMHWLSKEEAQAQNITTEAGGLFFPHSGWVCAPEFCTALATHPMITVKTQHRATALCQTEAGWRVEVTQTESGETQQFTAPNIIVANANAAKQLLPDAPLPLRPIKGQISLIPEEYLVQNPNPVLCFSGYVTPNIGGHILTGATYEFHNLELQEDAEAHAENLAKLTEFCPSLLHKTPPPEALKGRVALRCTTPDRLPLVGALSSGGTNAETDTEQPLENKGLYLSIGHGSKGLLTAPLAAEILASQITQTPLPVSTKLLTALAPGRFAPQAKKKRRGRAVSAAPH